MSTITTINGSDVISTSRTVINTNFSNLNTDKIETNTLDTDTTLAANSDSKIATQKAVKAYVDAGGNVNASETTKGIVQEATDAQVTAGTATGSTGAKLIVTPAKLATRLATLPPNTITHDFSSYTTSAHGYSDVVAIGGTTGTGLALNITGQPPQITDAATHLAGADNIYSYVILGNYVYILLRETSTAPDTWAVYRLDKSNIAAAGTLMTFSGAVVLTNTNTGLWMTSDGTYFYINYAAGSSANSYVLAKYSLSGTTFTYVSSITCGSLAFSTFSVLATGNIYAQSTVVATSVYKFNSSGALQTTYTGIISGSTIALTNINGTIYFGVGTTLSATFLT